MNNDIPYTFYTKVRSLDNGCMVWTGSLDTSGYGLYRYKRKLWKAHRFCFVNFYNKKIPKNNIVRHKCDNPKCVNPNHLELGTKKDNAQDREIRDRSNRRTRNNTHGMSKITQDKLQRGLELFKSGYTRKWLSEYWAVSYAHSCRLIKEELENVRL